jgi:hypothetical protein
MIGFSWIMFLKFSEAQRSEVQIQLMHNNNNNNNNNSENLS